MKNNADVMKIAAHIPKIYLIELMRIELDKWPNSRIPKKTKVKNKNSQEISLIFHMRLFLYAIAARISDIHHNIFDKII